MSKLINPVNLRYEMRVALEGASISHDKYHFNTIILSNRKRCLKKTKTSKKTPKKTRIKKQTR